MATYDGQLRIVWPTADGKPHAAPPIELYDAQTGEQIVDAIGMEINVGGNAWEGPVEVTLARFVDPEGEPVGHRGPVPIPEYAAHLKSGSLREFTGSKWLIGYFRYLVAATEVARSQWTTDTGVRFERPKR